MTRADDKDPNIITVFFANVTRMSEKAKHKVISRGDDVLLGHRNSLHCFEDNVA